MLASQMRFVMSFVGPTLLTRHPGTLSRPGFVIMQIALVAACIRAKRKLASDTFQPKPLILKDLKAIQAWHSACNMKGNQM
ncbi:hypothetical protein EGJ26_10355 [Stutzerimonas stutzeri]|nr:hypothetical protein EGJ26_10355 [Stutzerimonas stutzeri]HAJ86315.1 hypothetical protein [Pseudomonas sp.]RRV51666.1 hypothetical protein EGJ19_15405 [Stutzerimonas stutzeri]RRV68853.1 hypothetical protein EGI99_11485 [Stutzerimonas stutzeri]RRV77334.1 hypothetical protein EGJ18_03020 [Stutzerimonas stutzeri]